MTQKNVYEDAVRAASYAMLEFPRTYSLAFRDLPLLISAHVRGTRALDFGCGTGRSTRFLKALGLEVVGVDISAEMVEHARSRDLAGDYRLIEDGGLGGFPQAAFDLVLSAFTFDNIEGFEKKLVLLRQIAARLVAGGRFINLVSAPEIYVNEWSSFTTKDFPENKQARSGDPVKIVMTDVEDRRPVVDIVCSDEDYLRLYALAGFALLETHRPLARPEESHDWVNETRIAPWTLYVLGEP